MKIENTYEKDNCIFFWDSIFSQWYLCTFEEDGFEYSSAEQYMMIKKAEVFKAFDIAQEMKETFNPRKIKALGRSIPNFTDEEWDKHKINVVVRGNYLKFTQNKDLLKQLLSTGDKEIVEASPEDPIWGIGMYFTDKNLMNRELWGQNLLGKCLMTVRDIKGII